jgi:hypothetical protein
MIATEQYRNTATYANAAAISSRLCQAVVPDNMAVDFSALPPESTEPEAPPSKLLWLVVFLLLAVVGIVAALAMWPQRESTRTIWFWLCVWVYPVLIAALFVSRRFSIYEGHRLDASAWNEARKRYVDEQFELASIPLSILDAAFVFVEGEHNSSIALMDKKLVMKAQPSIAEAGTVTARWLKPTEIDQRGWTRGPDTPRQLEVLVWMFRQLLERTIKSIEQVPIGVSLTVKLHVSASALRIDVSALWTDLWKGYRLRPAHVEAISAPVLCDVESWLDSNDPIARRGVTLLISVNLNKVLGENPPDQSAEAGIALLLAHQEIVDVLTEDPIARLHRPTTSDPHALSREIGYALQWGKVASGAINTLWLTGIDEEVAATVHLALNQSGATSNRENPPNEVDLMRTVGHAGVTAPWLSVALAAEASRNERVPQLVIAQREGIVATAVVVPAKSNPETTANDDEPQIQA